MKKGVVIVKFTIGFGNNLFQYSYARLLAEKLGIPLVHQAIEQFNIPEEINFQREEKDHSSWGGGIHFCIGAHLARLELEVSFNHILSKNFTLQESTERTGAFGIRGFKELLVSTST